MSDPLLSNDSSRSKTPTPQVRAPTPTPVSRESAALKTKARTQGFDEAERERIPPENKQPGKPLANAPRGGATPKAAAGRKDSQVPVHRHDAPEAANEEVALEGMTITRTDRLEFDAALESAKDGIGALVDAMMRIVRDYSDNFTTALLAFQTGMTMGNVTPPPTFLEHLGTLAADGFQALLPMVGHPIGAAILAKAREHFASDGTDKAMAAQAARFSIAASTRSRLDAVAKAKIAAIEEIDSSRDGLVDDFLDAHFQTLDDSLKALEKSIPRSSSTVPPVSYFLNRLTAEWVTGPGATQGTTLSTLSKPRGRIVIHAVVDEDKGRYSPRLEKVTLDVAVLGANAAELVKDAIGRRGLFSADIPVDLNVQVPNQVGGRGYRRVHMLSAGVPERVPFLPNGRPAFDAIMNDSGFWTQAATQAASNLQGGS